MLPAVRDPGGIARETYSTNFDASENPISDSGAWTNVGLDWTKVVTSGGVAFGTHKATGYNDSYASQSGFGADQSAEATIFITGTFGPNQEVELLLRWTDAAHSARGYEILWESRNLYAYIVRWNGPLGNFTILKRLAFPRAPVTGDVFKAQIVGSVITVYLNGASVGSFTDSTWTTGDPGIGFYSDDASGAQNRGSASRTSRRPTSEKPIPDRRHRQLIRPDGTAISFAAFAPRSRSTARSCSAGFRPRR